MKVKCINAMYSFGDALTKNGIYTVAPDYERFFSNKSRFATVRLLETGIYIWRISRFKIINTNINKKIIVL